MSAKTMAEVLAAHAIIQKTQDQRSGRCFCGAELTWRLPTVHSWVNALSAHQQTALTNAGFGPQSASPPEVRYVDLTSGETSVLDEVVARNAAIHLEAMADNHWWMIITAGGQSVHVNLHAKRAKITGSAEVEFEPWLNEPRPAPPCEATPRCIRVNKHKSKCAVLG